MLDHILRLPSSFQIRGTTQCSCGNHKSTTITMEFYFQMISEFNVENKERRYFRIGYRRSDDYFSEYNIETTTQVRHEDIPEHVDRLLEKIEKAKQFNQ